jgi:hypothetical protein
MITPPDIDRILYEIPPENVIDCRIQDLIKDLGIAFIYLLLTGLLIAVAW